MLSTPSTSETTAFVRPQLAAAALTQRDEVNRHASQSIADTLALLNEVFAPQRRMVHAGDVIYQSGERFGNLYVLNSGFFKIVNLAPDGREQVVGLKFRGDWLGFDGIAGGRYTCDAVAMDTGEVWVLRYDRMLAACARQPELLTAAARGDEPRDRARPRFADVGVHAAAPTPAWPTSCATGPSRWRAAACAPTRSRCA